MDLNWTSKEDIALTLIFGFLRESRYNRTMAEYFEIETRLPTIEAAFEFVNSHLGKMAKAGYAPYEICYFKKGDFGHSYEPFPTSLSRETIRKAIKEISRPSTRGATAYKPLNSLVWSRFASRSGKML